MQKWTSELSGDKDETFLIDNIKNGFKIVDLDAHIIPAEMNNYKSTTLKKDAVEKQIKTEISEGRYQITSEKPTLISALGAIEKPDGGIRLIHDCSRPMGLGLNEYATQNFKIKYQTVKEACDLLKPGGYMAKVDLKSAYRSVSLHPSQLQYTGLKWTFSGDKQPTYLVDTRLPFGARLSPGHFNRLTQAVCRMMKRRGYKVISYLDDFWLTDTTEEGCKNALQTLISLLRELGFSIAWDKVEGPSQSIKFLGIMISSTSMSLSLPADKVKEYSLLLESFTTRSRASYRQLQQLAGKLSWASHVVKGGRIYLQRVLDLMRPLQHPNHKVRLSEEFMADIKWWLSLLQVCNLTHWIKPTQTTLVSTDACQTGAGLVCDNDWAYVDWQHDLPNMTSKHINVKETMAVMCAVYRWAPTWAGHRIIIQTDNITARAAINKGKCKDKQMMDHIRKVFWLSVIYGFTLECVHIPGIINVHADCVSRLRTKGHFKFWFSLLAGGRPYTIYDLMFWLATHTSVITSSYLLSQAMHLVPWLQSWTKKWLPTREWPKELPT